MRASAPDASESFKIVDIDFVDLEELEEESERLSSERAKSSFTRFPLYAESILSKDFFFWVFP